MKFRSYGLILEMSYHKYQQDYGSDHFQMSDYYIGGLRGMQPLRIFLELITTQFAPTINKKLFQAQI